MGKSSQKGKITREFSAGGVVYKKQGSSILWLVAESKPSKLYPNEVWRLPKGWLDDEAGGPGPMARGDKKATDDDLKNAAMREAAEEGGIEAKIASKVGTERFFFTSKEGRKILKFVTFYLMEWVCNLTSGPGFETEKVEWLDFADARKRLSYSSEKKILDKASAILAQGIQENLI